MQGPPLEDIRSRHTQTLGIALQDSNLWLA